MIVGPRKNSSVIHWDDRVVSMVSNHRTASMNSLTKFFSKLADAPSIVAVGALVAVVLLAQRK